MEEELVLVFEFEEEVYVRVVFPDGFCRQYLYVAIAIPMEREGPPLWWCLRVSMQRALHARQEALVAKAEGRYVPP